MTSRSIVLSTAALLLMTAAAPSQLGFSPTAAFAQEITVEAALEGNPAQFDIRQLRERVQVLREAIDSGELQGADRRAAAEKIREYREVLLQLRDERQEARQEQQAEQPRQGQRAQGRGSERSAEQRARRDQRDAERQREAEHQAQQDQQREAERRAQQAQQAEQQARQDQQREAERQAQQAQQAEQQARQDRQREAERQAQQAQQAEQQARQDRQREAERQAQQAEQPRRGERTQRQRSERNGEQQAQRQQRERRTQAPAESALTQEMIAAINDNRPPTALERAELRHRIDTLRSAMQSGALSGDQRRQVHARILAARDVLQEARAERAQEAPAEQPRQERQRRARGDDRPQREVDEQARRIISDNRPAANLDTEALRKRLSDNRDILGTGKLSRSEEQQLRQQLRRDREELRGRVASRQEQEQEQRSPRRRGSSEASTGIDTRDASRIIEQRIASDRLTDRELEERVRILSRALRDGNITLRESEVATLLVEQDRRELRSRLYAGRDRRRERRRSRNDVIIDFNVGYQPPPVIYAAEAMPRDIQMQLVAPPVQRMSRAYTAQEIATNSDVREMMPGIEIDTLNFDFGSAEVRPEEIDKLDDIAAVIEDIVAERPDEVFLIEGHTDAVGSDAVNDPLSQRRAEAVKEALLDYYDIYPENLQTVGLGKRYLKIWTPDPEEENRRVTVRRITPLLVGSRG